MDLMNILKFKFDVDYEVFKFKDSIRSEFMEKINDYLKDNS